MPIAFQHMRPDRDFHVHIVWSSIRSPTFFRNFRRIKSYPTFDVPYDWFSIMHYSGEAFAKKGLSTIKAKRVGNGEKDAILDDPPHFPKSEQIDDIADETFANDKGEQNDLKKFVWISWKNSMDSRFQFVKNEICFTGYP